MSQPPSYEDALSEQDTKDGYRNADSKNPPRLNIRDEVGVSRSQHVASLTSRLVPLLTDRAKSGLSKTKLLLIPSDQDIGSRGELVGFLEDEKPILIQLEGRYDTTQFWSQSEALDSLKEQMFAEVTRGDMASPAAVEPPPVTPPPAGLAPQTQPSFWARKRKASKTTQVGPTERQSRCPVSVEVEMDQINFRTETEYGLYETLRGRVVSVTVDVR